MSSGNGLDKADIYILNSLGRDGRKSFTDLAQELGVSVGMVRNRYKRLVDEGVLHIIGWSDPVKNGMNAYSRVVLKVRPTELISKVAEKLVEIPEVSFVALTTGNYDLEINVTCRDNTALLKLMHNKIHTIEGVYETNTTMYMQILKWAAHNVTNDANPASDELNLSMTDKVIDEH
tara:strand:+ start:16019 stop:16546 length:528 start_codon:yes stop_codon:yes gene_type:complete